MAVFSVKQDVTDISGFKEIDEITQYLSGRYISSNEAVWRILSFPIHDRYPPVVHLAVHLENGQRVYFTDANVGELAMNPPNTTLTGFFTLCQNDDFAKSLLYSEVPTYYTWNASRKTFQRRKRGERVEGQHSIFKENTIARLYTVHPNQYECFFLRLLLVNVRGPTCFQQLRTVNGVVHDTFRGACEAMNLLENDQHWDVCIKDSCETSNPHQIRSLFAIILTTCFPSSPTDLWEKYKSNMAEDILHRVRFEKSDSDITSTSEVYNEALINIEAHCLVIANKFLCQLGMPSPIRSDAPSVDVDFFREHNYNIEDLLQYVQSNIPLLTIEQKKNLRHNHENYKQRDWGFILLGCSWWNW
jgi:hypothetical protein